jgi:CheY-like chemotaxis protein
MNRARVLLVEDDSSVRRFVELALEDLAIELETCATVAEAKRLIALGPVHLLITDLMLPDESGFSLLRHLREQPPPLSQTRVVAYSAGITPAAREELESLQVWRTLLKPVPLATLRQCVEDGIEPMQAAEAAPGASAPSASDSASAEAHALATYFAGNEQLFRTYRASCLQQFEVDVKEVEAALAARDADSLRRLGHSLKTVLRTLGEATGSEAARKLEHAATSGDWPAVLRNWPALHRALTRKRGA